MSTQKQTSAVNNSPTQEQFAMLNKVVECGAHGRIVGFVRDNQIVYKPQVKVPEMQSSGKNPWQDVDDPTNLAVRFYLKDLWESIHGQPE